MTDDLIERLRNCANGLWTVHPLGDYGICDEAAARIATQQEAIDELVAGLRALFADYKLLADSGDAGFWSLEDLPIGIETLALLSKHGQRT
ncbi:MAG: hypothetical protein WA940_09165 [Sphingopyxis sp.]